MTETIHIYHTNDLHSHFENWPKIRDFLKKRKSDHQAKGEEVFLFDIGDFVDRWHPFTEGSLGQGNIDLLNDVDYTAVTIGNNEGITLPHEGLDDLYKKATFDVIAANLYLPNRIRPTWALPYKIYETMSGKKIAVTAVTAYFHHLYELLGWELAEPITELEMQLNDLEDQADFIIVLSHLGIHDDEKIAELFPQIDLILGGHTHHVLQKGQWVNQSLLAAAGRFGEYVGHVTADIHKGRQKNSHIEAKLFETSSLPAPINETKDIIQFDETGKNNLDNEVVTLDHSLDFSWEKSSSLSDLLCEALHDWCQADCTMINSGMILSKLHKGRVTKYDLHRMLPHPINPCTVELTGAELKEILFHAEDEVWPYFKFIGLGFRGKVMGAFVYHGIDMNMESREVYIAGKRLDPDRTYKLGTVDMFTFGKFFPQIRRAQNKVYFMPEFLRDIMAWKLQTVDLSNWQPK